MKKRFPVPPVIIFALILIAALLTWVLPGGQYIEGEFYPVESKPQTWQVFSAFFEGFSRQSGIIVFILVIGAAFWVINATQAVDHGIRAFLEFSLKMERKTFFKKVGVGNLLIVLVMLVFSLFGAVFGMSEETIAFTLLLIPLAVSMGYDSITGVCMVYVAAHTGFSAAFLNPFTVGIAQNLSGLPPFSGMGYRIICWISLTVISILFVLWYANRVRRDPRRSVMWEQDAYWRDRREMLRDKRNTGIGTTDNGLTGEHAAGEQAKSPELRRVKIQCLIVYGLVLASLTVFSVFYRSTQIVVGREVWTIPGLIPGLAILFAFFGWRSINRHNASQPFILVLLAFTILFLVVGVLGYGWYLSEISGLFLALGILSGVAAGYRANDLAGKLMDGARDILGAAIIVGLAAGIIVVLEEGLVIDRILYAMAGKMGTMGRPGSLEAMYGIQTVINLLIPSASAKAALTMPIMAPFGDLVGVSRQATVLAFQFGDGFTNMITPTSGVLMAVLGVARIPYNKWFRWIWPFILLMVLLGAVLLLPTLIVW